MRAGWQIEGVWVRAMRLVLLVLAASLAVAAQAAPTAPIATDSGAPRDRDLALYQAVVARVAAGESFYAASTAEQRARSFPVRPGFAVRLPTLAWIQAAIGPLATALAAYALLAGGALVWWLRLGDEGASGSQRRFGVALMLLGSSFLLNSTYHPLHELWAGGLIALALGLHRPGRWGPALAVAALALAIRELALPFVLLMAALAARRRDWRESAAWAALAAAFAAALVIHLGVVAQYQRADDLAGPSWLALRGVHGWIGNVVDSSPLYLLPLPLAVVIAALALFGWCSRRTPSGIAAGLLLLGYGLAFMIAGRDNNFYWGLLVTPILFAGLAFVPQALRDRSTGTVRGVRHA